MAVVRKKQDDKNLKVLREIVTSGGGNRQCFDCGQKGPTYVNMTIGSIVCTRCSGVLRGLTPPHRVKSISMATFTQEEIDFLKSNGNDACAKTWLGLWDPKRIIHQDQRELMIDKYERKRYYLEPASPLKSLTNATKVTAMNGSNHINNNTSNHNNNTNINNNINNISNKNNNSSLDNNLKTISLTPPNSLRLSNNSNGSMNGGNTTISGNRQQNRYNFQNQFTPEENNFFDTNHQQQQQQQQHHNNSNQDKRNSSTANGFLMNGSSNYNRQIVNNNKNSLNISTNTETNRNKFTPDSDFVADFGNAKIFNATTPAITIPPPMNGYKTKQHYQQNGVAKNMNNQNNTQITNFMNNANNGIMPSSGSMSSGSSSSATTVTSSSNNDQSNASENFADFDHAPIYNAAASYPKSNTNNFNNFAYSSAASNSSYGSNMNNNNINYNNQNNNNHNNQTVQSFNYSNQNHSNPMQWNLWQQFNWPSSPTGSDDHNRWSLPMSLNSTSSLSSSATFNSNSSFNSTPPADRYAALKDLDEQLREHKVTAVDSFSTSVAPSTVTSNVNPFKMQPANQTQHQQQQISNPFQGNFGQQPTTNGFFQSQTAQSLTSSSNIFGSNSAINSQMMVGSNFSNGYPTAMNGTTSNGMNNGNSCGFGFGGSISAQKNPFATTSHNSNNPFL